MKANENVYTGVLVAITIGLVFFVLQIGQTDYQQVLTLFTGIMFNVAIFLATIFSLQFFQYSTGTDIQKEIYIENNIAAANYQGMLFIALSIIISKGIM